MLYIRNLSNRTGAMPTSENTCSTHLGESGPKDSPNRGCAGLCFMSQYSTTPTTLFSLSVAGERRCERDSYPYLRPPASSRGAQTIALVDRASVWGSRPRHVQDPGARSQTRYPHQLALRLPAHAQVLSAEPASARDARHGGQRPRRRRSLTGHAYGGRASPDQG